MPVAKTFKQSPEAQAEIKKQLDRAMLPCVLDWPASIDMIGAHMRANYVDANGVFDVSFENTWASILALKALLIWTVAPRSAPKDQILDNRGQIIPDRRQQKKEAAQRAAEEAAKPRKTFEGELKKAETNAKVNRTIEETRDQIAAFRGPSHSVTYRVRDAATAVLDKAIASDRTLGGIATAASDVKLLMLKAWE